VAEGFDEEALPAQPDAARQRAIVEHDRRAQCGEVLDRAEPDLFRYLPFAPRLAVDGVLVGDVVRPAKAQYQRAETAPARREQRVVARAREVHRRMRLLVRLREDRSPRDLDVLAVVLDLVLHEDLRDQVHRFVDHRLQLVEVVAECASLLLRATLADAEVKAALGKNVERRDALGDLDRVIHRGRQAHDAVSQLEPGRLASQVSQEGLGRGHVRVLPQCGVLDRPDAVEAHRFGEHGLLDDLVQQLELGFA
jgi:hypothetical protein